MEEHWVTAAIAEDWLASSGKNRKVDGRDVVKYSKVMTRDDWDDFHPEGLIFDWDGRLIDGRHRLAAVMRAAETEGENFRVGFVCMLGFDPETKVTTNTGRARTMAQTSQIIGQDATAAELAIVKALWIKPSPAHSRVPRVTDYQEVFSTYDKFKEGIQLAAKKSTGRGGVSVACVRAVLARAFYHYPAPESLERLKRFIYVLDTGLSENEEEFPAVLIRNAYMNQTKPGTAGTLELYRKTLYAVDAYMKGNTIKSLRQLKTQPFPLKDLEPDKED